MVPRYLPSVQLASWARWLVAGEAATSHAREAVLTRLRHPRNGTATPYPRARHAIRAYLEHGLGEASGRSVVVSAQICPLVPLIVRRAGFQVRFVDTDGALPTPAPGALAAAVDEKTAAIIVSPMYGHMPNEWLPLLRVTGGSAAPRLFLDLAQGLGLEDEVPELLAAADAVVYSFSVGKGLDCGGGLLLTRAALPPAQRVARTSLVPLVQAIAVRTLYATGTYRWAVNSLDAAVEADKLVDPSIDDVRARTSLYTLWHTRLEAFLAEIALARSRSAMLSAVPRLMSVCRNVRDYLNARATHLRQVLRFHEPSLRDRALVRLRRYGIDAAPAGEPMPSAYFPGAESTHFPNAAAFRADAIRLPFLGRLSASEFDRLLRALEAAFA